MADKALFQSVRGKLPRKADTRNRAGGNAYAFDDKHALAQYVATGCLSHTFYADAAEQLDDVLKLAAKLDADFVAKAAVYARTRAHMKDTPALLAAVLAARDTALLRRVFARVIDNGRMLRNFVQVLRSGVTGRKSLGTAPKRLVLDWLAGRSESQLLADAVGNDPSLADIIKMVHPKPADAARAALYAYFIGKPHDADALPQAVRAYEAFKRGETLDVPQVPFQLLTSLPLGPNDWVEIAKNAKWQMTRMNLNTFARHGVFQRDWVTRLVADRLRNPAEVKAARALPYQLMVAWMHAGEGIPGEVLNALQDAMEVAIDNVPAVKGKAYVLVDVSGSMDAPVTGYRKGASSVVKCRDVAALFAAAMLRRNGSAEVLPFHTAVERVRLNPRDSVVTNARVLAGLPSGGTDCSVPLRELNARRAEGELVVFVSDNESWVDSKRGSTAVMDEWARFKARNPRARLACVDLAPNRTTQAHERDDVLNVGGFSDQVFELVKQFSEGSLGDGHWVGEIEKIEL